MKVRFSHASSAAGTSKKHSSIRAVQGQGLHPVNVGLGDADAGRVDCKVDALCTVVVPEQNGSGVHGPPYLTAAVRRRPSRMDRATRSVSSDSISCTASRTSDLISCTLSCAGAPDSDSVPCRASRNSDLISCTAPAPGQPGSDVVSCIFSGISDSVSCGRRTAFALLSSGFPRMERSASLPDFVCFSRANPRYLVLFCPFFPAGTVPGKTHVSLVHPGFGKAGPDFPGQRVLTSARDHVGLS